MSQSLKMTPISAIGDYNGHVGLGVKCSKEVATAIRGAIILAKLCIVPVRRGFWGNKIGRPRTVPCKVTGKYGSVWVRLIPAPRGTGIVSAPAPKKLLQTTATPPPAAPPVPSATSPRRPTPPWPPLTPT